LSDLFGGLANILRSYAAVQRDDAILVHNVDGRSTCTGLILQGGAYTLRQF
jgi:hypothetical protein